MSRPIKILKKIARFPLQIKEEGFDTLRPLANPPHVQKRTEEWKATPWPSIATVAKLTWKYYRQSWKTGYISFPDSKFWMFVEPKSLKEKRRRAEMEMLIEEGRRAKEAAGKEGVGFLVSKLNTVNECLGEFVKGYKDGRTGEKYCSAVDQEIERRMKSKDDEVTKDK